MRRPEARRAPTRRGRQRAAGPTRWTRLAVVLAAASCAPPSPEVPATERAPRLSVARTLARSPVAGFARALAPRPFTFPADHGPHPDFQTEWWYFTGNLEAQDGRRFGYQLTFFRSALTPPADDEPGASSAWTTAQIYMAHLGLTDPAAARFHSAERFSRGALGLAGAVAAPHRVWLATWEVGAAEPATRAAAPVPALDLTASDSGFGLDLRLLPLRDPVFHGESGLSRKGSESGNASYYFSVTRWATSGTVRTPDGEVGVLGLSWMDREWSTSVLEEGQVGWDWFSLQLDDGSDLMFFRLRRADGTIDSASAGTLVSDDGSVRHLARRDVDVAALERWTSPRSGAVYPARWRLTLDGGDTILEVHPVLADQEHRGSFAYWEGAVDVTGTRGGGAVAGRGYVELTGYAGE